MTDSSARSQGRPSRGTHRHHVGRRPDRRHRQLRVRHPRLRGEHRRGAGRARARAVGGARRGGVQPRERRAVPRRAGRGRLARRTRLAVNAEPSPAGALLATGFGYDPATHAGDLERVARVMPLARDLRRIGAASLDLAFVAAGRLDGYFERGLQPWDHAAGALLVAEAGGRSAARGAGRHARRPLVRGGRPGAVRQRCSRRPSGFVKGLTYEPNGCHGLPYMAFPGPPDSVYLIVTFAARTARVINCPTTDRCPPSDTTREPPAACLSTPLWLSLRPRGAPAEPPPRLSRRRRRRRGFASDCGASRRVGIQSAGRVVGADGRRRRLDAAASSRLSAASSPRRRPTAPSRPRRSSPPSRRRSHRRSREPAAAAPSSRRCEPPRSHASRRPSSSPDAPIADVVAACRPASTPALADQRAAARRPLPDTVLAPAEPFELLEPVVEPMRRQPIATTSVEPTRPTPSLSSSTRLPHPRADGRRCRRVRSRSPSLLLHRRDAHPVDSDRCR